MVRESGKDYTSEFYVSDPARTNRKNSRLAQSVAVAIFLVLELDRPFGGWIEISNQPFEMALRQLGK